MSAWVFTSPDKGKVISVVFEASSLPEVGGESIHLSVARIQASACADVEEAENPVPAFLYQEIERVNHTREYY
jgi:hypothetical protein